MSLAKITEIGGVLCVKRDDLRWRRINGTWQMLGRSGKWFDCEIQDPLIQNQVEDYEYCLRSYGADEGPEYPKGKKGYLVGKFYRELQKKELAASTKNIFAPVRLNYDATAENRARFNRDYSYKRLSKYNKYLSSKMT